MGRTTLLGSFSIWFFEATSAVPLKQGIACMAFSRFRGFKSHNIVYKNWFFYQVDKISSLMVSKRREIAVFWRWLPHNWGTSSGFHSPFCQFYPSYQHCRGVGMPSNPLPRFMLVISWLENMHFRSAISSLPLLYSKRPPIPLTYETGVNWPPAGRISCIASSNVSLLPASQAWVKMASGNWSRQDEK